MRIIAAILLLATTAGAQTGLVKAFTGAMLIDGTDHAPVPSGTLVVRHGRIVAAGPASSAADRVRLDGGEPRGAVRPACPRHIA